MEPFEEAITEDYGHLDDIVLDYEADLEADNVGREAMEGFYNLTSCFGKFYDESSVKPYSRLAKGKMTASTWLIRSNVYKAIIAMEERCGNSNLAPDKAQYARVSRFESYGFSLVKSKGGIIFAKPPIFKLLSKYLKVSFDDIMYYSKSVDSKGRSITRRAK